jgi:hypothetical protein
MKKITLTVGEYRLLICAMVRLEEKIYEIVPQKYIKDIESLQEYEVKGLKIFKDKKNNPIGVHKQTYKYKDHLLNIEKIVKKLTPLIKIPAITNYQNKTINEIIVYADAQYLVEKQLQLEEEWSELIIHGINNKISELKISLIDDNYKNNQINLYREIKNKFA